MHKVTFVPAASAGVTESDRPSAEEKLKRLVREALVGKGFQEKPGVPFIWRRRGARVEVYRDQNGELILGVGAFGSKRDVRVSEQTEQELLAVLRGQPDWEVTPTALPRGTSK